MNNRQNGRRRGRGGQQARNGQPGGLNNGSRLDNRARGNAAQLLEKYKTLARDAQMQGDRVNTEYYLQFADHYFRVLSENRARFEEQRPRQQDYRDEQDGGDEDGDYGQSRHSQREDQGEDGRWYENAPAQSYAEQPREPRREREPRDGERQAERGGGEGRRDRNRANGQAAQGEGNRGNGRGMSGGGDAGDGYEEATGFAAPDFLSEPLQPRFDAQAANGDADDTPDVQAVEEAPKRRRGRPRRTEAPAAEA